MILGVIVIAVIFALFFVVVREQSEHFDRDDGWESFKLDLVGLSLVICNDGYIRGTPRVHLDEIIDKGLKRIEATGAFVLLRGGVRVTWRHRRLGWLFAFSEDRQKMWKILDLFERLVSADTSDEGVIEKLSVQILKKALSEADGERRIYRLGKLVEN